MISPAMRTWMPSVFSFGSPQNRLLFIMYRKYSTVNAESGRDKPENTAEKSFGPFPAFAYVVYCL